VRHITSSFNQTVNQTSYRLKKGGTLNKNETQITQISKIFTMIDAKHIGSVNKNKKEEIFSSQ
jgi:hypothetical protein